MTLSQSIADLLARAAQTSMIDDHELDALGRRVLETLILDPETPHHLREAAQRRLLGSEHAPASPTSDPSDVVPD